MALLYQLSYIGVELPHHTNSARFFNEFRYPPALSSICGERQYPYYGVAA